jgi:nitroreductase
MDRRPEASAIAAEAADRDEHAAFDRSVAEVAVEVASRAPSIHNTQPWSWEFGADGLALRADRSRQLVVADPDGHSLMISCGAALTLTEVGLRAAGWTVTTLRLPDSNDPELLARFSNPRRMQVSETDRGRVAAALRRHSDRRPFSLEPIPDEALESLRAAADGDGVHVHFPTREEERVNLAVAVSWADRIERHDAEYVAEMARWLRDEEVHADGVPLTAVPKVAAGHPRHTDVPLRDFELGVSGRELIEQDVDEHPVIAVLLADSDSPLQQLHAGEAMMKLMIQAEIIGVASCPLSQAVDLVAFRSRLQALMDWQAYPQMMLRLGYPSAPTGPTSRAPRRSVRSMLHDSDVRP